MNSLSHDAKTTFISEGVKDIPLWHIHYFELKSFHSSVEKQQVQKHHSDLAIVP